MTSEDGVVAEAEGMSDDELLEQSLGPRRGSLSTCVFLTLIYSIIFVAGVLGNLCTCYVIKKHASMRSVTNRYLFSLAISDLLLLIFGKSTHIWHCFTLLYESCIPTHCYQSSRLHFSPAIAYNLTTHFRPVRKGGAGGAA